MDDEVKVLSLEGLGYFKEKQDAFNDGKFATKTHMHSDATGDSSGFMSATDKSKLDGIEDGANNFSLPEGGTVGQVLTKTADGEEWANADYAGKDHTHTIANVTGLQDALDGKASAVHTHAASDITSGTLSADRIPTITDDKIQSVAASKLTGTIPSENLPSYVDDVVEYNGVSSFPEDGETGKIYVDTATNKTYRWGGSNYVEISASLALGTTSSTAFRGDYGNAAYTHAVTNKGSAFGSGLYKITTNSEGHVTAATAVTKTDITALGIPGQDTNTTYENATTSDDGLMSSEDKAKLDGIATGANKYTHPNSAAGAKSSGLYKIATDAQGHVTGATAVAKGDITALGIPAQDTTYSNMKGATSSAAGAAGLVPAPSTGASNRYLRSDGTWTVPPDTNTTYSPATQSTNGLMSAADKKKLDGLEQMTAITNGEIDDLFA